MRSIRNARWLLWALLAGGCTDRQLAVIPDDPGVIPTENNDLAVNLDLAPPSKPCHLVSVGAAVQTMHFDNPQSQWRCEGVLGLPENRHVVHYGTVQLRFGGWSDPAIHAREYDVSVWPPTPVAAESELSASMHSPPTMYLPLPGTMGVVFWTDNDGGGPVGVKYRTITPGSWTLGPDLFLAENHALLSNPVETSKGDQFALVTSAPAWPILPSSPPGTYVSTFTVDGSLLQRQLIGPAQNRDNIALGRTDSTILLVTTGSTCNGDAGCTNTSFEVQRVTGGNSTTAPITLEPAASIKAPISGSTATGLNLLSDHDGHHFLTWWEYGDARTILYAMALHADGKPAGPAEVWLSTPYLPYTRQATPSIGPLGVVYPVALSIAVDAGGYLQETHLLQRQLVENAPINDTVLVSHRSSWAIATTQFDNPRTLILGYSDYAFMSDKIGGYGMLAKFTCEEDAP